MIVFIDTEVNPQTKKAVDYGAVREDGAVFALSFQSRLRFLCDKHKRKENITSAALSLMESRRYIFPRLRDWEAVCSSIYCRGSGIISRAKLPPH